MQPQYSDLLYDFKWTKWNVARLQTPPLNILLLLKFLSFFLGYTGGVPDQPYQSFFLAVIRHKKLKIDVRPNFDKTNSNFEVSTPPPTIFWGVLRGQAFFGIEDPPSTAKEVQTLSQIGTPKKKKEKIVKVLFWEGFSSEIVTQAKSNLHYYSKSYFKTRITSKNLLSFKSLTSCIVKRWSGTSLDLEVPGRDCSRSYSVMVSAGGFLPPDWIAAKKKQ